MKPRKCKYVKICKLYAKDSVTCNETGGDYYGPGDPAGCYIKNEENERKKK